MKNTLKLGSIALALPLMDDNNARVFSESVDLGRAGDVYRDGKMSWGETAPTGMVGFYSAGGLLATEPLIDGVATVPHFVAVGGDPPHERRLFGVRGPGDHRPGGHHAVPRPGGDRRRPVPGQREPRHVPGPRAESIPAVAGTTLRSVSKGFKEGSWNSGWSCRQTRPPAGWLR